MDGEALGAESVPTVGGVVAWGMNGLTRPPVEAGGLTGFAGGVEAVFAAGGFAGICAGGLAGVATGAGDVIAAGGVAGVCPSAPDTRMGSPASAPTIQTRSVMHKDLTQEAHFMRARKRFTMPIKVTNLSPQRLS